MTTTERPITRRNTITSLRWGTVPYTHGSGLHIGCGEARIWPNAVCIDAHRTAATDMVMRLDGEIRFTDGTYDFIVLGSAMRRVHQPFMLLSEAWRMLGVGGFLILQQPTPRAVEWLTAAAPDHALIEQMHLGAHRVDVLCKLAPGSGRLDARLPAAEKSVGIVRPGAYGDALWASSILPAFKRRGYQVTVYTEAAGEKVLRHDPHLDAIVVTSEINAPLAQFTQYCAHEMQRHDNWVDLTESVEKNLLAVSNDMRFYWPAAMRRRIFGGSYIEAVHDLAEVPHDFQQRFYPTEDEIRLAAKRRGASRQHAVIAASGSTLPKFWPYTSDLADALITRGYTVTVLGDLRGLQLAPRAGLNSIGTQWSIRDALTFAQQAELVIGQETAITNAVALEPMLKIVLLSHSTAKNLTSHWTNTVALHGTPSCYPCHRVHLNQHGWHHCNLDEATGGARCQSTITVDQVLAVVDQTNIARAAA